jgi:hypothetical protein
MPQLLLQGFPCGAIRIGTTLSVLRKDGTTTYFVGADNHFSHRDTDRASQRYAIATLIHNGHVRPCEVEASPLGIAHRTLMNWMSQLADQGPGSFFAPRIQRGQSVMTPEKAAECSRLLDGRTTMATVARIAGVKDSTLRKAVKAGRVHRFCVGGEDVQADGRETTSKSARSQADARAAAGMGTACTRADERMAAALGLIKSARTRFDPCLDVPQGGVLAGLPALCSNGLLSGLERHLALPEGGYYSAFHILVLLGFMALARIRRPEGLRHIAPGELGKTIGLDRVPEVRTLREKIAIISEQGRPQEWMKDLSIQWMKADPLEAGYLYVDGHVRVYHGEDAQLPKRFVSREKLCLRGTTDYWVNDALGRPFFVVSQPLTDGLSATLIDKIVPELLANVPGQPSDEALAADPLLHRFVVIFDREGSSHSLLSKLWEKRIGAITYRKAVKDLWPVEQFAEVEVLVPGGGSTLMRLASRQTTLSAATASMPVLEVRRLTQTGHQTAIITTAQRLQSPLVAGRMFSRWCQENFFGYMMEHYDIDGLVQYGSEEIPGTTEVVNPEWRVLDKAVYSTNGRIRKLNAELGARMNDEKTGDIVQCAELLEDIQRLKADLADLKGKRRETKRKVTIDELPESERPTQLRPLAKMFTDTVKMIAYRAETTLVGLLSPHLARKDEARALIRELFVSSADIMPDDKANTLTVRVHRMACSAHDKAIAALLADLTAAAFQHPETGMTMIYELLQPTLKKCQVIFRRDQDV